MTTALSACTWVGMSILISELLGYLLHRLMHSGTIGLLSRSHMRHHLLLYGPLQPQRSGSQYQDATTGKVAIGNVGLEWLLPGAAILVVTVLLLHWFRVELVHQAIFVAVSLLWSFLMFSYLHDRMHVTGFWMARNRWLKSWFLSARRAHDIHHWALDHRGLMDKNFGIGFFFFDRCFGTFTMAWPVFNNSGYAAARQRFGNLLSQPSGSSDFAGGPSTVQRTAAPTHPSRWTGRLRERCFGCDLTDMSSAVARAGRVSNSSLRWMSDFADAANRKTRRIPAAGSLFRSFFSD